MLMKLIAVCHVLLVLVQAYPKGGPLTLCNDPYPHHHGHPRLTTKSPYTITLSSQTYKPGDEIEVTIKGSVYIRGFHVGVHSAYGNWENLYGEFIAYPDDVLAYKYFSTVENCLTHNLNFTKPSELKLKWRAPAQSVGDLILSGTVMKSFDQYWVNMSAVIQADSAAAPGLVTPARQFSPPSAFHPDLNLNQCGTKSGCSTYPKDCDGTNCQFITSFKVIPDGIRIRLTNNHASKFGSYIALGISEDMWMPKDETFICLDVGGSLDFTHGYNPDYYNTKARSDIISDVAIQSVDGAISCEFTRKVSGYLQFYGLKGLENKSIDYQSGLDNAEHHLYLAWGPPYEGSRESAEKHHELPIVSHDKVAFNSNTRTSFYTLHNAVKVHVTFMVVAWLGAAAIASIVARYYRTGFLNVGDKLCGLKAWFQVHRALAIISALLSASAFVVIFVHYMKLTSKQLLHASFGIGVTALMVLQVLAGMLRPNEMAGKKRAAFNWAHRLSGMIAYIGAAVTIFLGAKIPYMPEIIQRTGTGLLAGLVATHVFFAIIFEIMSCQGKRSDSAYDVSHTNGSSKEMTIEDSNSNQEKTNPYGWGFSLFSIYCVLIISLLVCYLGIVWIY